MVKGGTSGGRLGGRFGGRVEGNLLVGWGEQSLEDYEQNFQGHMVAGGEYCSY